MGVSAAQGSAGLKPGVCTSTTRPSNPFEGQMIYETDTDKVLIYNGTAWVIPNSSTTNPTGLEFVSSTTIAALSTTTSVSNCFSADYLNYRVLFTATVATANIRMRLNYRDSGGDVTTANYQFGAGGLIGSASWGVDYSGTSGQTSTLLGESGLAGSRFSLSMDVYNPFATDHTTALWQSGGTLQPATTPSITMVVTNYTATTSMTGFTIQRNSGTGTFSGVIKVYGYRNS